VNPECAMIDLKWSYTEGEYNKIVYLNLPLKSQFNLARAIFLTYTEDEEIIVKPRIFNWNSWEIIFHDDINKIRVLKGLPEAKFPRYYSHPHGFNVK
jgi:hypothetical protein